MPSSVRFAWHELRAREPAKAMAFYPALLGWAIDASSGICTLDGGALAVVTTSKAPPHVPSHWLPMMATEDPDAAVGRARSLGARILGEPMDRPSPGRVAVIADPQGAVFGVCGRLASPIIPAEGGFAWDELLTRDAAAAAGFYAELFGLAIDELDLGPMGTYRILRAEDAPVAGVMTHPEAVHPHWLPYLAVADVDAATRRAVALGGSVYLPPRDAPGLGRFSAIDDPTGAGICLLRRTEAPTLPLT